MVNYRRIWIPGGTFFFTLALRDRREDLLIRYVSLLHDAFRAVHAARPWCTEAIVVMPDHLHSLWTLPEGDRDYPGRWRAIKSDFVRRLRRAGVTVRTNAKGEADIWQRRYWEHAIRDETDLERHIEYIHINPVKHGHAVRAADWPHSSIHRFIGHGIVPSGWAAEPGDHDGFGE